MILIVGLGNPGEKYKNTRHNIGFMVINKLKEIQNFSDWKQGKKFNAQISEGILKEEKITLAKPQTFMNNSGKAVKSIINYSSLKIDNPARNASLHSPARNAIVAGGHSDAGGELFIIQDDIDLPAGQMKISKNRGSAGHKGVQSIIDTLGNKNFVRFRIGIKKSSPTSPSAPAGATEDKQSLEKFVLKNFTKPEQKILEKIIEKTCVAIAVAIEQGVEKAMSEYNKS